MKILVTGAAGFIGYHLSDRLLKNGYEVIGIDNLNNYYDVRLKNARLDELNTYERFSFKRIDISDYDSLENYLDEVNPDSIIHLAAQAGVRFSITHPQNYVSSNLVGHSNILEIAKKLSIKHLIYASSSSVYGDSSIAPYSEEELNLNPESFYAATKLSCEILSQAYTNLYGMKITGLRFFTVYGPWGRPDMAYYSFTQKIIKNEPIQIFGDGESLRDFTYINDIIDGIYGLFKSEDDRKSHEIYNIGKSKPITVKEMVAILEKLLNKKANVEYIEEQKGDVRLTYADISKLRNKTMYHPEVNLKEGLTFFIDWYKRFHN